MSKEAAKELTSILRDRAGERLRGVTMYDGEEYELLYLREDVRGNRLKSEVDDMLVYLQRNSHAGEEAAFHFGAHRASTQFYDDAVVIHVPDGDHTGTVVTLDNDGSGQLDGLVEACIESL